MLQNKSMLLKAARRNAENSGISFPWGLLQDAQRFADPGLKTKFYYNKRESST